MRKVSQKNLSKRLEELFKKILKMTEIKQVILIRDDLKLSKGKLGVQIAHGAVEATLKSDKKLVSKWRLLGQKKVSLKVKSKEELYKFNQMAKEMGFITALIKDAGKTEILPGTETVLAIGPDYSKDIDKLTKDLNTL